MHPHPSVGGEGGGGQRVVILEVEVHLIVPSKEYRDNPPRCLCPHTKEVLMDILPLPLQVQAHREAVATDAVHILRDDGLDVAPAVGVPGEACCASGQSAASARLCRKEW